MGEFMSDLHSVYHKRRQVVSTGHTVEVVTRGTLGNTETSIVDAVHYSASAAADSDDDDDDDEAC